jgi:hypothetical protein
MLKTGWMDFDRVFEKMTIVHEKLILFKKMIELVKVMVF